MSTNKPSLSGSVGYRLRNMRKGALAATLLLASMTHQAQEQPGSFWNEDLGSITTRDSRPGWMELDERIAVSSDQVFQRYARAFGLGENDEMRLLQEEPGEPGRHFRYRQYHRNIEVEHSMYTVHEKDGQVYLVTGKIAQNFQGSQVPSLDTDAALTAAKEYVGASLYCWESDMAEAELQQFSGDPRASHAPRISLLYTHTAGAEPLVAENMVLAYRVHMTACEPYGHHAIYVDAQSGEVVRSERLERSCQNNGETCTPYNGQKLFTTESHPTNGWVLEDACRNIQTYYKASAMTLATSVYDSDNAWVNSTGTPPTNQCPTGGLHWASQQVWDYFKDQHNRDGYDGNHASMVNVLQGDLINNAYFINDSQGPRTVYGRGDGVQIADQNEFFVAIEVVGHEWTHAMTATTADLLYQKESGALNESFSDIFGIMVEDYVEGPQADFLQGEDFWGVGNPPGTDYVRNMGDPHDRNQPDTYLGTFWYSVQGCTPSGANNFCGVHTNSGVQNYWFYLLSIGGTGTNNSPSQTYTYNVGGIGKSAAARIAYRALTVYLTPYAEYIDARKATIRSAEDLFGACSYEVMQTQEAWDAVGVYDPVPPACFQVCADLTTPSCVANNNGGIQLVAPNASGSVTYAWSNGMTGNTLSGLSTGTYTVTITDLGCTQVQSFDLGHDPFQVSTTSNTFGGDVGTDIDSDVQGDLAVTGYFYKRTVMDNRLMDNLWLEEGVYLGKLTECGELDWLKHTRSSKGVFKSYVDIDETNDYAYTIANTEMNHDIEYVDVDAFGSVSVEGGVMSTGNLVLSKHSWSTGNLSWMRADYPAGHTATCIHVDEVNTDIYVGGNTAQNEPFIMKLKASDGSIVWIEYGVNTAGGVILVHGIQARFDPGQNATYIYAVGEYETKVSFGTQTVSSSGTRDGFGVCITETMLGNQVVWLQTLGGIDGGSITDIVVDDQGYPLVTGTFESGLLGYFGGTAGMGNTFGHDVFVARLEPFSGEVDVSLLPGTFTLYLDFPFASQAPVLGANPSITYAPQPDGADIFVAGGFASGELDLSGLHNIPWTVPATPGATENAYLFRMRHPYLLPPQSSFPYVDWIEASEGTSYQTPYALTYAQGDRLYMTGAFVGNATHYPYVANWNSTGAGSNAFVTAHKLVNGWVNKKPQALTTPPAVQESEESGTVTVYPNPTVGNLTVTGTDLQRITVMNPLGQPVYERVCSGNQVEVDLGSLPVGWYAVRVESETSQPQVFRVIRQHGP